ncbi:MAG TPA: acyltransferase family protein [Hyphomicrobium sp.]|nr:acyltransferase family protein [Hyphomicrobium sp.]
MTQQQFVGEGRDSLPEERGTVQPASFAAGTHRLDIDGLRGLAVAGVVAYHFGLGMPGGYGGVDVFFVISGFLIAGIIKSELEAGTFSIANFYVRRIRRILPALTVCLLASSIAATLFLFPHDFKKFGQSLIAASLSVSNFYFSHKIGYFDNEATDKPLLHTWSLGVEEQFYIVFPLMLLLLFRYARKSIVPILWIVAIASFAYSCHGIAKDADKAFFSTAGRAWELGIGALLAFGALPKLRARGLLEVEAAIGALLIAFCFLAYSDETRFPGLAALPLCLGAALIIHSGNASQPTAVASMLSSRPAVGLGLISYSVYLWHWPLLVFALYRWPSIFSGAGTYTALLLLGLASLVIGALSWAFVEQPFRRMSKLPRATVFLSGGLAVALTAAISGVVVRRPMWLQHWPESIQEMHFGHSIPAKKQGLAQAHGWPADVFIVGAQNSTPDTVVWGDSYTNAMAPGFVSYYRETGRGVIIAALSGCRPLVGVSLTHVRKGRNCERHNAEVFDAILQHGAKRVILIGFWAEFAENIVRDPDGSVVFREHAQEDGQVFEATLRSMIGKLTKRGIEVVIVGPVPVQKFQVAPAVARHILWNEPLPPELTRTQFLEDKAMMFDIFTRMATLPHVRVVYPDKSLCDAQGCDYIENGIPLYSDHNHLSPAGVAKLSGMFSDMFTNMFAAVAP